MTDDLRTVRKWKKISEMEMVTDFTQRPDIEDLKRLNEIVKPFEYVRRKNPFYAGEDWDKGIRPTCERRLEEFLLTNAKEIRARLKKAKKEKSGYYQKGQCAPKEKELI